MSEALNTMYQIENTLELMLRLNIIETAAVAIMSICAFVAVIVLLMWRDK